VLRDIVFPELRVSKIAIAEAMKISRSDERPGTSEKSSGLKVTNVARCTKA